MRRLAAEAKAGLDSGNGSPGAATTEEMQRGSEESPIQGTGCQGATDGRDGDGSAISIQEEESSGRDGRARAGPEGTEDVGFAGQQVSHDVPLLSFVMQDDDLHEAVEKVREKVLHAALADLERWGCRCGEVVTRREEEEAGGFVSANVWKGFLRQREGGRAASRVDILEGMDLQTMGLTGQN